MSVVNGRLMNEVVDFAKPCVKQPVKDTIVPLIMVNDCKPPMHGSVVCACIQVSIVRLFCAPGCTQGAHAWQHHQRDCG